MIIAGNDKDLVVENIKNAANSRQFYNKVEVNDPNISEETKKKLIEKYLNEHDTVKYKLKCWSACRMVDVATGIVNKKSRITGQENIKGVTGGAIITSNHFNPDDSTIIRKCIRKSSMKRLFIVSQDTNMAMSGFFGYLLNYADIIPITDNNEYMKTKFPHLIKSVLKANQYVLIYPEQEMWLNYKKPRPPKRGAYYYAARFMVPVISCFVEMKNTYEKATEQFYKVEYILHVLPTIYPDPDKSVRENSVIMMKKDYEQKKAAYEAAYGKKLDYDFEYDDIAGLIH